MNKQNKRRLQMQKPKSGKFGEPSQPLPLRRRVLQMKNWQRADGRTWVQRERNLFAVVTCVNGGWAWAIMDKEKRVYANSIKITTRSRKARKQAQHMLVIVAENLKYRGDKQLTKAKVA